MATQVLSPTLTPTITGKPSRNRAGGCSPEVGKRREAGRGTGSSGAGTEAGRRSGGPRRDEAASREEAQLSRFDGAMTRGTREGQKTQGRLCCLKSQHLAQRGLRRGLRNLSKE